MRISLKKFNKKYIQFKNIKDMFEFKILVKYNSHFDVRVQSKICFKSKKKGQNKRYSSEKL